MNYLVYNSSLCWMFYISVVNAPWQRWKLRRREFRLEGMDQSLCTRAGMQSLCSSLECGGLNLCLKYGSSLRYCDHSHNMMLQSVGTRNGGKEVNIATMWFTWTLCGLLFLPANFDIWYHDHNILSWRCGGTPMDELGSPLSPFPLGTCKASQSVLDVITDLETNFIKKQSMAKSSPLIPVPISWSLWLCGLYIILSPGFDTGDVDVFHDSGKSWLPCIPLCWLLFTDSSLVSTDYQELHSVQTANENTAPA